MADAPGATETVIASTPQQLSPDERRRRLTRTTRTAARHQLVQSGIKSRQRADPDHPVPPRFAPMPGSGCHSSRATSAPVCADNAYAALAQQRSAMESNFGLRVVPLRYSKGAYCLARTDPALEQMYRPPNYRHISDTKRNRHARSLSL